MSDAGEQTKAPIGNRSENRSAFSEEIPSLIQSEVVGPTPDHSFYQITRSDYRTLGKFSSLSTS